MVAFNKVRLFNNCLHSVEQSVFLGKLYGLRVDVAHIDTVCAHKLCCDAQNATATAYVNDGLAFDVHKFKTHTCGGVFSCAKSHTGVKTHNLFTIGRGVIYPSGDNCDL